MRRVLITGCSSGIGRAMADAFKTAGYEVWASARKPQDVAQLTAAGFTALQLDVNDQAALAHLAERLAHETDGLDVLINNAGYGAMGPLLEGGVEGLQQQFETNVFSVIGVTRALFGALRSKQGLVVNIGSVSGVLVTPFAGAYCASKAAVHALSDALRMEVAPFGIRVLEVQPGAIDTHFAKNANDQAERLINQNSAWWPMREGIRARANASQDNPTSASTFASAVLKAVKRKNPPHLLRYGNGSRALPLLATLVPNGLLQKILMRRFGLSRSIPPTQSHD
ncbi:SDR family oxidoreductase [Pseudomonas sp. SIMBA_077]